jgi:molybdenum cofactor cytidylyltransferase
MSSIGIVVLAAGASKRLGTPKQLLHYEGQTLLRRAAETALATACGPVVVVLGAHAQPLVLELQGLPVRIVKNPDWEQGMRSSIRPGMEALLGADEEALAGVIFMLCDQPLVTVRVLEALIQTHAETGKGIVACAYGGTWGVPALFSKTLFWDLATLGSGEGAKQVLANHPEEVATICFPEGALDVDTPQDYARLREVARTAATAKERSTPS